jgi:hypothetical protein
MLTLTVANDRPVLSSERAPCRTTNVKELGFKKKEANFFG